MASKRLKTSSDIFVDGIRSPHRPRQCRSMATEAPASTLVQTYIDAHAHMATTPTTPILHDKPQIPLPGTSPLSQTTTQPTRFQPQPNPFTTTCTLTTHAFPSLEPTSFTTYPSTHLSLPLRKDILHRAVVYEGDMTRQGTASTKWRSDVHGSNRKIRPQKGTGKARLGNKKSPMLKGGGVAFGPHPRDFSTGLSRKVYDLAWRTALSYRYCKGELLLVDDIAELEGVHHRSASRYLLDFLRHNHMGHAHGRTLFITLERRDLLFGAFEEEGMGRQGRALEVVDVDVKDLLELGRVVVEREALEWMLVEHEEDVGRGRRLGTWEKMMVKLGKEERKAAVAAVA